MSTQRKIEFLFSSNSFEPPKYDMQNDDACFVSISNNPSMPVMWESEDEGEVWSWGDYLLVLQKKPRIMAQKVVGLIGDKSFKDIDPVSFKKEVEQYTSRLRYQYCLSAFYRKNDSSNSIISARPAFILTIEQVNYGFLKNDPDMKEILDGCDSEGWETPLLCAFVPSGRITFDGVKANLNKDEARKLFFEKLNEKNIGRQLYIGSLEYYKQSQPEIFTKYKNSSFSLFGNWIIYLGVILLYLLCEIVVVGICASVFFPIENYKLYHSRFSVFLESYKPYQSGKKSMLGRPFGVLEMILPVSLVAFVLINVSQKNICVRGAQHLFRVVGISSFVSLVCSLVYRLIFVLAASDPRYLQFRANRAAMDVFCWVFLVVSLGIFVRESIVLIAEIKKQRASGKCLKDAVFNGFSKVFSLIL